MSEEINLCAFLIHDYFGSPTSATSDDGINWREASAAASLSETAMETYRPHVLTAAQEDAARWAADHSEREQQQQQAIREVQPPASVPVSTRSPAVTERTSMLQRRVAERRAKRQLEQQRQQQQQQQQHEGGAAEAAASWVPAVEDVEVAAAGAVIVRPIGNGLYSDGSRIVPPPPPVDAPGGPADPALLAEALAALPAPPTSMNAAAASEIRNARAERQGAPATTTTTMEGVSDEEMARRLQAEFDRWEERPVMTTEAVTRVAIAEW